MVQSTFHELVKIIPLYYREYIIDDRIKYNNWVLKHLIFPHSLYEHPKPRAPLLHQVSPILPHISIRFAWSLQAHLYLITFPLMT